VIVTVDIGTSSFKSALWDFDGRRLAFAAAPLSMTTDGVRHEAECGQWLQAFGYCCAALSASAAGSLAAAQAIVISGNGPSLAPVFSAPEITAQGLNISAAKARLWLDRRATAAAAQVSAVLGDFVDASFFLPKALAIKNDEPELYDKTRFFLGCPEFLAYALCGEARTVFPAEGFDRWFWNAQILNQLQLDADKFPRFIMPGEIFGQLLPAVAAQFGFAAGIPIISGGPDFFAAILGAGVVQPGQCCDRTGTSEGINLCTKTRIFDKRLMSYGHAVKPFWNLSGIISTTGKAIEWARGLLGLAEYDDFFTLAESAAAGCGGMVFLPYLAGERAPVWNPHARGVLRGLSLASGRAEFARSVLEGIGFAIRDVISAMEDTGAAMNGLRVAGTGNALLHQIKADITGKELLVPAFAESELSGLAILGAVVLGKFQSYTEASAALVQYEKHFFPDEKKKLLYDQLFEDYRAAYR
jgi:xylulokinase